MSKSWLGGNPENLGALNARPAHNPVAQEKENQELKWLAVVQSTVLKD